MKIKMNRKNWFMVILLILNVILFLYLGSVPKLPEMIGYPMILALIIQLFGAMFWFCGDALTLFSVFNLGRFYEMYPNQGIHYMILGVFLIALCTGLYRERNRILA